MESIHPSLLDPALARESSILSMEFETLSAAYPNGNWSEILLQSCDEPVSGNVEKDNAKAILVCVERGIPKQIFDSPDAFHRYIGKLKTTSHRFAESLTACMRLPVPARLKRAAALNKKYSELLKIFADEIIVDPVELGILLGEFESERNIARISLALSASKKNGKYPKSLDEIASRFGNAMPSNRYNGQSVEYQPHGDQNHFSLNIPATNGLSAISFESQPPSASK